MTETTHAYVAVCPHGKVTAACVDTPEYKRDTAKDVAAWVRGGRSVERVTVEEARVRVAFCDDCAKAVPA